MTKAATLLLLVWGVAACASVQSATADGPPDPVAAPPEAEAEPVAAFYTAEQAERGSQLFNSACSSCHGFNQFTGPIFSLTWMAEPVGNLFEHVATTMPQDRPGSLTLEEYAAVLAYFLELNGRVAGDRELPSDPAVLSRMRW